MYLNSQLVLPKIQVQLPEPKKRDETWWNMSHEKKTSYILLVS